MTLLSRAKRKLSVKKSESHLLPPGETAMEFKLLMPPTKVHPV